MFPACPIPVVPHWAVCGGAWQVLGAAGFGFWFLGLFSHPCAGGYRPGVMLWWYLGWATPHRPKHLRMHCLGFSSPSQVLQGAIYRADIKLHLVSSSD